ncbi:MULTISPECIES: hypothetical protein [unclassified Bradyrhizobium]|uniref:hypothetical protein n=1 Tax=unclassified Bradyrhizobium TaxID=2631580 RepID=UPI0028EF63EA|nr:MULTISPECIES: hypothetical protein [unclassified Bradyrhizobium]
MPGDGLTHGPPAKKMQAAGTTGAAGSTRHSLRDGLTAYTWSPWCAGLSGHHVRAERSSVASATTRRERVALDTSVGVSGHHDFTVRVVLFVRVHDHAAARCAHRSPHSTFVTIAIRPLNERGMPNKNTISGKKKFKNYDRSA